MKISEILRDKELHTFNDPLSMIIQGVKHMGHNKALFFLLIGCVLGIFVFSLPEKTSSASRSEEGLNIQEANWEYKFHQQINQWIHEIGRNDSQFEAWLKARFTTHPLGPGSRQWVVLIYDETQEIGYLIMEQIGDEPRFALIEYGKSDQAVLSKILAEEERTYFFKEHFFYHGLIWAKVEDNGLVDLITLETYEHVPLEQVVPFWKGEEVGQLLREKKMMVHDAHPLLFLADALKNPNKISPANLLEAEHYFFQARLLPGVTGLYHVVGVHTWSDVSTESEHLFIGLEDEGIRYFSAAYLDHLGTFERIELTSMPMARGTAPNQ